MEKLTEAARVIFHQNPDGTTSIIGSWFTYANFTLATGLAGFAFLIACIITAAYYVLVVVTEPSQQRSSRSAKLDISLLPSFPEWDFERVLQLLSLAYTTFTTLDLEDVSCQSKILCEFQETDGIVGKATRRISNFLLFFSFFKTIPYIGEYQEAVRRGQGRSSNGTSPDEDPSCEFFYPSCEFSVVRFNEQYNAVFVNNGSSIE